MGGCYSSSLWPGETWTRTITWTDGNGDNVNLSGYSATMTFSRSGVEVVTLTNGEEGGLTLGEEAGTIIPILDAETTAGFAPGTMNYDLWLTSGTGVVSKLLCGELEILAG